MYYYLSKNKKDDFILNIFKGKMVIAKFFQLGNVRKFISQIVLKVYLKK